MGNFMFNCLNQHDKASFKCLRSTDKARQHCAQTFAVYLFRTTITKIESAPKNFKTGGANVSALRDARGKPAVRAALRRRKIRSILQRKRRENGLNLLSFYHSLLTHQTRLLSAEHNLIIMTITDERQGPFKVAPIAAIK